MSRVRDPDGQELIPTLLHVLERDEHGNPTTCRIRYDHEKIKLDRENPDANVFLTVWAPSKIIMGELRLEDLAQELEVVKTREAELQNRFALRVRAHDALVEKHARLEYDNEQKTTALRDLQRERDPDRMERMVSERTSSITAVQAATKLASDAEIAGLKSRVAELEASKRKLRDAIERAKK